MWPCVGKKYTQVTLDYSEASSINSEIKKYYEGFAQAYGTTYTSIKESAFVDEMSNSTYFGGVLHGGEKENKLKISGSEVLYLSEISAISDTKFNSVKVIVLTSCYSGRRGGFVDTLLKKGVDVVIGFSGEVEQKTSVYWTTRFIYALTQGNTVADAISSANSELDKKYMGSIYESQIP